ACVMALDLPIAAIGMQAAIHRIDPGALPERLLPPVEPGVEVGAAAQGTGSVTRGQRHRFVPEEQRRPAARLPLRCHPPLVLEEPRTPPGYLPRPHDPPVAVDASPIAHEQPALVDGD